MRVGEEGVGTFDAGINRLLAEELTKLVTDVSDPECFASCDVDNERRRGGLSEGLQRDGIRIALPDDVDGGHGKVDWLAGQNLTAQIDEDTVAQFAGVIEAEYGSGSAGGPAEVVVDPLAA